MITLDDHVNAIYELKQNGYDVEQRWNSIVEDDHFGANRWDEGEETITHVSLVKDGLLWRGFVNRVPKEKSD